MKVVLFSPPKVVELYVGLTSFLGSLLGPTERVSSRKNGVKIFFLLIMMVLLTETVDDGVASCSCLMMMMMMMMTKLMMVGLSPSCLHASFIFFRI